MFPWHAISRQLASPNGIAGGIIGLAMRFVNERPNRLAVDALQIRPGDTILELGFGPGHAIEMMAASVISRMIYGVDQSDVMLRQATRRNREAVEAGRVRLQQGIFEDLPFPTQSIDKILAVNVVYFWRDATAVIREIRRVLRPGGRLSIYATDRSTMRHWKFARPDTHRHFSADDLTALLQAGDFELRQISVERAHLAGGILGLVVTATR